MEWLEFYGLFDSMISVINSQNGLDDIMKFAYLRTKLEDEPARLLAGLSVTSANFAVAIEMLKEEYEDLEAVIDIHYSELIAIPRAKNVMELKSNYHKIEGHLRCLDSLKMDTNHRIFVTIIKSKIPPQILATLNFRNDNQPWTVSSLKSSIKTYILAYREVIEIERITWNLSRKRCKKSMD